MKLFTVPRLANTGRGNGIPASKQPAIRMPANNTASVSIPTGSTPSPRLHFKPYKNIIVKNNPRNL